LFGWIMDLSDSPVQPRLRERGDRTDFHGLAMEKSNDAG
jgi:hypothetical protein